MFVIILLRTSFLLVGLGLGAFLTLLLTLTDRLVLLPVFARWRGRCFAVVRFLKRKFGAVARLVGVVRRNADRTFLTAPVLVLLFAAPLILELLLFGRKSAGGTRGRELLFGIRRGLVNGGLVIVMRELILVLL